MNSKGKSSRKCTGDSWPEKRPPLTHCSGCTIPQDYLHSTLGLQGFKLFFRLTWEPFEAQFGSIEAKFANHTIAVVRLANVEHQNRALEYQNQALEYQNQVLGYQNQALVYQNQVLEHQRREGE